MKRRTFLATAGAVATGLAGCIDLDEGTGWAGPLSLEAINETNQTIIIQFALLEGDEAFESGLLAEATLDADGDSYVHEVSQVEGGPYRVVVRAGDGPALDHSRTWNPEDCLEFTHRVAIQEDRIVGRHTRCRTG